MVAHDLPLTVHPTDTDERLRHAYPLVWSSQLSTGISSIDEQHRQLFSSLEDLEYALREGRTIYAVYTLTRLHSYVREHFAEEEELMRQHHYPRLPEHLAEHQMFRDKVRELATKALTSDISHEIISLLRDWLLRHIGHSDMDYVTHLR